MRFNVTPEFIASVLTGEARTPFSRDGGNLVLNWDGIRVGHSKSGSITVDFLLGSMVVNTVESPCAISPGDTFNIVGIKGSTGVSLSN